MPESNLDKIVTVFDSFKRDILTFNVRLAGKDARMYLLDELLYDDHDLLDYQKLGWRMRKLPAVLTFYITMKKNAQRELSDTKEEFDSWYGRIAAMENDGEVARLTAQPGPASLKKPPTIDQIRGLVERNNPAEWRSRKDKIRNAQENVDMLEALYEGLKSAIDLIRSEEKLFSTAVGSGLEQVRSNPEHPLNRRQRP